METTVRVISHLVESHTRGESPDELVIEAAAVMGLDPDDPRSIPFACGDATAGSEIELQAAVIGNTFDADLPTYIRNSDYYSNIRKHDGIGDVSKKVLCHLDHYLSDNKDNVWENSWVRFPKSNLSRFALQTLDKDLRADKADPESFYRKDIDEFITSCDGIEYIRIPASYLLKLALCDSLYAAGIPSSSFIETGKRMSEHFLSDNTSPEIFSFHVCSLTEDAGFGNSIASETAVRFLLCSLLAQYSNTAFGLNSSGQKSAVYFSPLVPQRQKYLNDSISDSFYRELFMSPCLSGWNVGEKKREYMSLCHLVLSRSRLNALYKLREAGIIANDLVVLPKISNTSLANNGIHISLGSKKLGSLMASGSRLTEAHEKAVGDLVIKIYEHFLPLFPGLYSASPYRMPYEDLRPEKALSFLPHELDYTHLRMLWQRWLSKSSIRFLNFIFRPSGERQKDQTLKSVFALKGDFIPDFRVIDYLASLLSTERSSPLSGRVGNDEKLRKELEQLGVFSSSMSLYLLYKMRSFSKMGFSGYEGRYYSLFYDFKSDMRHAVNLQLLITSLAYLYIARGEVSHSMMPDTAFNESERRQIFYSSAIGVKAFNIHSMTDNLFMKKIVARCRKVRPSKRYRGYNRIPLYDYLNALVETLETDAAPLIEAMSMQETIADLKQRISRYTDHSAAGKLLQGIMKKNVKKDRKPIAQDAPEFNRASERFYRDDLRVLHMAEGLDYLEERFVPAADDADIERICGGKTLTEFIAGCRGRIGSEHMTHDEIVSLIHLIVISEGKIQTA